MCGGDIALNEEKTFGTCEYCGSAMTLPKVSDEQRAARFNRGNHFRRQGEFDKALGVYESIVNEDDSDAEAHWCCALCRFGIEYVEDPNTFEYFPTCHRASFDSFLEDVDYKAALENSDGITRRQYQKDAAKIAEVQKGILATSRNEEPFDVFICYKETDDATKERTRDSLDAQEIYYQLTQEGYRVFFSRITLENKAGTEYEPYIFAALNSAKVMIAIGSKPEYFNAVWVKNEWSRFLAMMRKDRSKLLLPCYKGMDPYDLPEQLGVLQSYDMTKIGFMQDLIRGIKKVLQKDEPKPQPQPTAYAVPAVPTRSENAANIVKLGMMNITVGKETEAQKQLWHALEVDSNCAEAYFGLAILSNSSKENDTYLSSLYKLAPELTETERSYIQPSTAYRVLNHYLTMPDPARINYAFSFIQDPHECAKLICKAGELHNQDALSLFLNADFDPNERIPVNMQAGKQGLMPLLFFAIWKDFAQSVMRRILEKGADVNVHHRFDRKEGYHLCTPLAIAVQEKKDPELTGLLLEFGAAPEKVKQVYNGQGTLVNQLGASALAVQADVPELLQAIIAHGVDINARETSMQNSAELLCAPLYLAVRLSKSDAMLSCLLKNGADPNQYADWHNQNGSVEYMTPLTNAISNDDLRVIRILLQANADITLPYKFQRKDGIYQEYSLLSVAVQYKKKPETVRALLEAGADPNSCRKYAPANKPAEFWPVLWDAIHNAKNAEYVELLLQKGANPNFEIPSDLYRRSAISEALLVAKSNPILALLLKYGANPHTTYSPKAKSNFDAPITVPVLDLALVTQNIEGAKLLLQAGASMQDEVVYGPKGKKHFRLLDKYYTILYFPDDVNISLFYSSDVPSARVNEDFRQFLISLGCRINSLRSHSIQYFWF